LRESLGHREEGRQGRNERTRSRKLPCADVHRIISGLWVVVRPRQPVPHLLKGRQSRFRVITARKSERPVALTITSRVRPRDPTEWRFPSAPFGAPRGGRKPPFRRASRPAFNRERFLLRAVSKSFRQSFLFLFIFLIRQASGAEGLVGRRERLRARGQRTMTGRATDFDAALAEHRPAYPRPCFRWRSALNSPLSIFHPSHGLLPSPFPRHAHSA